MKRFFISLFITLICCTCVQATVYTNLDIHDKYEYTWPVGEHVEVDEAGNYHTTGAMYLDFGYYTIYCSRTIPMQAYRKVTLPTISNSGGTSSFTATITASYVQGTGRPTNYLTSPLSPNVFNNVFVAPLTTSHSFSGNIPSNNLAIAVSNPSFINCSFAFYTPITYTQTTSLRQINLGQYYISRPQDSLNMINLPEGEIFIGYTGNTSGYTSNCYQCGEVHNYYNFPYSKKVYRATGAHTLTELSSYNVTMKRQNATRTCSVGSIESLSFLSAQGPLK